MPAGFPSKLPNGNAKENSHIYLWQSYLGGIFQHLKIIDRFQEISVKGWDFWQLSDFDHLLPKIQTFKFCVMCCPLDS